MALINIRSESAPPKCGSRMNRGLPPAAGAYFVGADVGIDPYGERILRLFVDFRRCANHVGAIHAPNRNL